MRKNKKRVRDKNLKESRRRKKRRRYRVEHLKGQRSLRRKERIVKTVRASQEHQRCQRKRKRKGRTEKRVKKKMRKKNETGRRRSGKREGNILAPSLPIQRKRRRESTLPLKPQTRLVALKKRNSDSMQIATSFGSLIYLVLSVVIQRSPAEVRRSSKEISSLLKS